MANKVGPGCDDVEGESLSLERRGSLEKIATLRQKLENRKELGAEQSRECIKTISFQILLFPLFRIHHTYIYTL